MTVRLWTASAGESEILCQKNVRFLKLIPDKSLRRVINSVRTPDSTLSHFRHLSMDVSNGYLAGWHSKYFVPRKHTFLGTEA